MSLLTRVLCLLVARFRLPRTRRHFFIRDMVESFEIEVPFVRTHDNLADFFTKPCKSASQFHAWRKRIMNEP